MASQLPVSPTPDTTGVAAELASFRLNLESFKREQEASLLDMSRSKPKNSGVGGSGISSAAAAPFLGGKASGADKGDLSRVLDTDIILVALSDVSGGRDKWPSALVANFPRSVAELGFMESNGSLWRMVKAPSQDGQLKLVLQTAEIGEKEMFLSADLELVKSIQQAAVWSARVVPPTSSSATAGATGGSLQLQAAAANSQGLLIQLELQPPEAASASSPATGEEDEPKLLVTASSDSGEGGVAILTQKQRLADTSFRWGLVWEVVREDVFVEGLDDLAAELELAL